jgi:DNA polymerase elongation subunit (family B)
MRPGLTCPVQSKSGNSKFQEMTYVDADGRLMVDLLPLIKREHLLDNYKLKTVAAHFLGEEQAKDPLTVQGIFACYEEGSPASMARVGKYCVQDSAIVALLWTKLKVWYSLCETANINNVPIPFIYTRGEQIRMLSSVYRYAAHHAFVVDVPAKVGLGVGQQAEQQQQQKYTGAQVLDPVVGLHAHGVLSFDFGLGHMAEWECDHPVLVCASGARPLLRTSAVVALAPGAGAALAAEVAAAEGSSRPGHLPLPAHHLDVARARLYLALVRSLPYSISEGMARSVEASLSSGRAAAAVPPQQPSKTSRATSTACWSHARQPACRSGPAGPSPAAGRLLP